MANPKFKHTVTVEFYLDNTVRWDVTVPKAIQEAFKGDYLLNHPTPRNGRHVVIKDYWTERVELVVPGDVFVTDDADSSFVRITVLSKNNDGDSWKCETIDRQGKRVVIPKVFETTLLTGGHYRKESA